MPTVPAYRLIGDAVTDAVTAATRILRRGAHSRAEYALDHVLASAVKIAAELCVMNA
jgi:hypothetical protein